MKEKDPLFSSDLQRPEKVAIALADERGEIESEPRLADTARGADTYQLPPTHKALDDDGWGSRRVVERGSDPVQLEPVRAG